MLRAGHPAAVYVPAGIISVCSIVSNRPQASDFYVVSIPTCGLVLLLLFETAFSFLFLACSNSWLTLPLWLVPFCSFVGSFLHFAPGVLSVLQCVSSVWFN